MVFLAPAAWAGWAALAAARWACHFPESFPEGGRDFRLAKAGLAWPDARRVRLKLRRPAALRKAGFPREL